MAADTQSIAGVLLSLSAAGLLFYILRLRQRRRAGLVSEEVYSGQAKNPERFMQPDAAALADLDRLLEEREFSGD